MEENIGRNSLQIGPIQNGAPLFFEALEERPTRDQLNHFMLQLQHLTGHRGDRPRRWTEALLHFPKFPRVICCNAQDRDVGESGDG
jgi:hypothetical protein